jgi:TonB-dependent SusC/RagA subfamily outer membrane receptor
MKAIKVILLIFVTFLPVFSSAQKSGKKINISGKVTDINNNPVPGAAIFIDKVKTDVVTDAQGVFRIKVRPDAKEILVFTLLNGAVEEPIAGRNIINFVLTGKSQAGPAPKASVETKQDDNIKVYDQDKPENQTYQSIYDMIRGRFPGVEVNGKSIRIRGTSSLNVSTEPLFVVDGIIINDIESISPQNVRSIEILKGSDATVYGNRGSNGVIVIKTITGKDIK